MSRRLAADVGWLWVGYVGRSLAYLGLVVVLTTNLGPSGFGRLSLFLAVTLGVAQLAGGWPFLAVPVLSGRGRSIAAAFRPAVTVAAAATVAALAVAVPVVAVIESSDAVTLIALCVYSVALVGLQGIYGVLQTEGKMAGIAVTQTAERAIGLVAMLLAVAAVTLTVQLAEALLAISAALACIGAYAIIERRQRLVRPREEAHGHHTVATVMSAVGAMGIVSVCSYGIAWLDVFILAAFRPDSDVGIYSLAYQVFAFTIQIGSLWIVATLPRHARSSAEGQGIRDQLPIGQMLIGAYLWGALIVSGAIVSALLLPQIFGEGFRDAVAPLMILLSGTALGIGYFAATPAMVAGGRTATLARLSATAVAINLGLDLILVPAIGLNGPAIATVAQTVFSAAAVLWAVLGTREAARMLFAGLPAALGIAVLAIGETETAALAVAALAGVLSAGLGARALRASRRLALA
jgi:O-antigen/teichoic acid export membrane protein